MSRLLLDTNCLMDALVKGRPGCSEAREVIRRCNGMGDFGMACSLSFKDVYYLLGRYYGEPRAREMTSAIMGEVAIAPVSSEECDEAMRSGEPDFEDGIVRACAEHNDADFIITRDAKAFRGSRVPAISAAEYLDVVRRREEAERELLEHGGWPW